VNIPDPKFQPGDRVRGLITGSEYIVAFANAFYPARNPEEKSYWTYRASNASNSLDELTCELVPAKPKFAVGQVVTVEPGFTDSGTYRRILEVIPSGATFSYALAWVVQPFFETQLRALTDLEANGAK
jgi:hypothetical protein